MKTTFTATLAELVHLEPLTVQHDGKTLTVSANRSDWSPAKPRAIVCRELDAAGLPTDAIHLLPPDHPASYTVEGLEEANDAIANFIARDMSANPCDYGGV